VKLVFKSTESGSERKARVMEHARDACMHAHDPAKWLHMTKDNNCKLQCFLARVGQNRVYTPYMTVYLVTSLPETPHKYGSSQSYKYTQTWATLGV